MMEHDSARLIDVIGEMVNCYPIIKEGSDIDEYDLGFLIGRLERRQQAIEDLQELGDHPDALLNIIIAHSWFERSSVVESDFLRGYDDALQFSANLARGALTSFCRQNHFDLPVLPPSDDAERLRRIDARHFFIATQLLPMAVSGLNRSLSKSSRYVLDSASPLH